jgi:hypothetical protein
VELPVELRSRKEATITMIDPYLAEREMGLSTEEASASAEQARLARPAKGDREPRRWWLPLASAFRSLEDSLMRQRLPRQEESST